jgi:CRISPR-associated protein Cas2
MLVLVAYDVSTQDAGGRRRLRRVAQECENFGVRVQKSLFECILREQDWVRLKARLLNEFDKEKDSLRFYFFDEATRTRTEHHGTRNPPDMTATMIV